MEQAVADFVREIAPTLQTRRRDLHKYAESGWLEFRTATLVAEELHRLGYPLKLGREVIDADARMGLPSAEVLAQQEQRALSRAHCRNGCHIFPAAFVASSPP